jgi:hydroxymethylbilane synthase
MKELVSRQKILVGSRGSRLALRQTELVINALKKSFPDVEFEIVTITTKGDRQLDRALLEFGGKAVFVEEFEQALIDEKIDMAVHSAKDMPMELGDKLVCAGVLERATPNDVLIYKKEMNIENIAVVGTSSLRRRYQIERLLPGVKCTSLRGNINTRIEKLREGTYDAIILAAAGIERLQLDREKDLNCRYLSVEEMLPAACQGIIAIETRNSGTAYDMALSVNHRDSYIRFKTERQVLAKIGAGCHEPVGVYSEINGDDIHISLLTVDENDGLAESKSDVCQTTEREPENNVHVQQATEKEMLDDAYAQQDTEYNGGAGDSAGPCIHTRVVTGKINDIPNLIENLVKC